MGDALTVYAFLRRHSTEGFCDDCIEQYTGVARRHVGLITSTLALFPAEFVRSEGLCGQGCSRDQKDVISAI